MTVNIIQLIIAKLKQYPHLKYKVEGSKIEVEAPGQEGFSVSLSISDDGFTVYFDGWHETFVEEHEALDCFVFGLSEKARIRVHKRGKQEYKWTLQHLANEEWVDESTTGLMFYPFWQKEETFYRQNKSLKSNADRDKPVI